MNSSHFEETQLQPLATDADILDRVRHVVGRASSRQLWLLFLDDLDVQLPLLIPIEGLPASPGGDETAEILDRVREVMQQIDASSIIVVHERYAGATLTPQDAGWARSLRRGCDDRGVEIRGQLLSYRGGVRWIDSDEILGSDQPFAQG